MDFRPPEKFDRTLRSHGTVPIQQECSQTSPHRPPWAQYVWTVRRAKKKKVALVERSLLGYVRVWIRV